VIRVRIGLARPGFALDVAFETETRVTGVLGPSGAGKTTLVHVIAGLMRPDRGEISIDGDTVFDSARGVDLPPEKRRIGVVFQEHRLFPHLSVKGNLLYACRGGAGFERTVDLLELGPLVDRRVHALSGGERQRVALGRALLSSPRLLLLDEPLASLDGRLRRQIIPFLRRVVEATAVPVMMISHDLTEILQLTDRLLVLDRGGVLGHGRLTDVIQDVRAFGVVREGGLSNVLFARVVSNHPEDGVSVLGIGRRADGSPETTLLAPMRDADAGAAAPIAIAPTDVALAPHRITELSIQNQIRGVVRRCSGDGRRVIVELDIGVPLIAEISRPAAAALRPEAGRELVCLIKSQSIQHL
jgi:molybdate transport system ATP-binding protein